MTTEFVDVTDVGARLEAAGYFTDVGIDTVVFLAARLGKPILIEGPAGVGKTELAKSVATALGAELVRLQCYEGLDEAKALYEWNYARQLLRITHARTAASVPSAQAALGDGSDAGAVNDEAVSWSHVETELFSEDFLLERPLLHAIRRSADEATVLLIDEVDKVDFEFEALLLEILSDFQVTIPELGTLSARRRPFVVLTSNATRELSEALKRRCLYLHLDYPTIEREEAIVRARVPELDDTIVTQVARVVRALRELDLKKPPSISETIDWAKTIVALGVTALDRDLVDRTLGVLLKYDDDLAIAAGGLSLPTAQHSD
ncbi:MAG: MoxR family ATPase [Nitriliruptoraceae bacterium]